MTRFIKTALAIIVVVFVLLFVLTTFVPAPAAEYAQAQQYFTPEEISDGATYALGRRLFMWAGAALELGLLLALAATPAARRLADRYGRWLGFDAAAPVDGSRRQRLGNFGRWLAVLLLMGATYAVLHELLHFPLAVGRFRYSHAWGMTQRPFAGWLGDYLLGLGLSVLAEMIVGVGLYVLLRCVPRTWYLWGALGGTAMAFGFAYILPVVVAPLFNTFTPLSETHWASLDSSIRHLADEAGISIRQIYVIDASRQGNHTNAYFSGLGSTQSIVLYDTLLKNHENHPEEIVSILAHEIGHWKHQHIIQGILLGGMALLVALIVLDRMLRWFRDRPPVFLHSLADPAGVPLVLLLAFLGTWIALPLQNAVSRHFERQADQTSLELAGKPEVFIRTEEKLVRDNIGNVVPAPWNVWLFATHPTALQRIEMARQWHESR